MKFGQLIACNMRNIFLEKSCKIATERISGSIISSFTQFVFIVYKVEVYRNILKLSR